MSTSSYQHIDHLVPPGRLRKLQIVRGSTPAAGTGLWHQPTMETGYLSCFIFYFQHRDVSGLHTLGLFHRQLGWSRFCLCSRFHGVCCNREWCCCARTILKWDSWSKSEWNILTFELSSIGIPAFDMNPLLFWVTACGECGCEISQIIKSILLILAIFVAIGISEFCKLIHNFFYF